MARLPTLPSMEIIRGLKGVIDFAVWKGLPYARAWPRYRPAQRSAAAIASAILFGQIVKAYSLLASEVLAFYQEDATDQPRTARDLMISGVLGHLHEVDMSDFLDLLTECRDSLVNLEALLNALKSVDTDALQVRGRDQLFSFKASYSKRSSTNDADAGSHTLNADVVPEGEVWIVTNAFMFDRDNALTQAYITAWHDTFWCELKSKYTVAAKEMLEWQGLVFLTQDYNIRYSFVGTIGGDDLRAFCSGYKMTLEA